jgi:hypothetical protein
VLRVCTLCSYPPDSSSKDLAEYLRLNQLCRCDTTGVAAAVRHEGRRARACWEASGRSRSLAGPIAAARRALPDSVCQSQRCEQKALI